MSVLSRNLALLMSFCVLVTCVHAEVSLTDRLRPDQPPLVIAHRALSGGLPENSLAAIAQAIAIGADMVEIDVQRTRDNQHVLMHNSTLNAMTDVESVYPDGPPHPQAHPGSVRRDPVEIYTLEEIRQLRLMGGELGERVPTLDEALDLIDGKILALLDLKSFDPDGLIELLTERDNENLLIYGLNDSEVLDVARRTGIDISLRFAYVRDPVADLEQRVAAFENRVALAGFAARDITPELIARGRQLGVTIVADVFGILDISLERGEMEAWQPLLSAAPQGYITDKPGLLLKLPIIRVRP